NRRPTPAPKDDVAPDLRLPIAATELDEHPARPELLQQCDTAGPRRTAAIVPFHGRRSTESLAVRAETPRRAGSASAPPRCRPRARQARRSCTKARTATRRARRTRARTTRAATGDSRATRALGPR